MQTTQLDNPLTDQEALALVANPATTFTSVLVEVRCPECDTPGILRVGIDVMGFRCCDQDFALKAAAFSKRSVCPHGFEWGACPTELTERNMPMGCPKPESLAAA